LCCQDTLQGEHNPYPSEYEVDDVYGYGVTPKRGELGFLRGLLKYIVFLTVVFLE
jgi:hypothetical protein